MMKKYGSSMLNSGTNQLVTLLLRACNSIKSDRVNLRILGQRSMPTALGRVLGTGFPVKYNTGIPVKYK